MHYKITTHICELKDLIKLGVINQANNLKVMSNNLLFIIIGYFYFFYFLKRQWIQSTNLSFIHARSLCHLLFLRDWLYHDDKFWNGTFKSSRIEPNLTRTSKHCLKNPPYSKTENRLIRQSSYIPVQQN